MTSPSIHTVAMQVTTAGEPLVEREVTLHPPIPGWVHVQIMASGVCHADLARVASKGASPEYPVTPGHEVAGLIDSIGDGVDGWSIGDRVVVGWFGGSCGHCRSCRSGDVVHCSERKIPGLSYPGGWAQSITVPADALARIPDGMDFFDAAPMGCAGVTTFNAIRSAGVSVGGRVAVFGLGGLGHLAVQFASRMGFETVAIARGPEREAMASRLGAHHYIDSNAARPGLALANLGGADLIISTASTTKPVADLLNGLKIRGRLTLIGIDAGTISLPAAQLVRNAQVVTGHLTGSPLDIEDTMHFAVVNGIAPWIERLPLTDANEAVARLKEGQARFRFVLDPSSANG